MLEHHFFRWWRRRAFHKHLWDVYPGKPCGGSPRMKKTNAAHQEPSASQGPWGGHKRCSENLLKAQRGVIMDTEDWAQLGRTGSRQSLVLKRWHLSQLWEAGGGHSLGDWIWMWRGGEGRQGRHVGRPWEGHQAGEWDLKGVAMKDLCANKKRRRRRSQMSLERNAKNSWQRE